jgi:hypothetical protein
VMDAIGFEYPDYERLDKGAKGQKRKKVASALDKDEEDQPKKKKQESEAKAVASKKRKTSTPKQKSVDEEEKTSATSSAAEIEEILKVMTETLPLKLSPLGLHLTKLFHKEKEPTKTKAPRPKRQRIVTVTEVMKQLHPGLQLRRCLLLKAQRLLKLHLRRPQMSKLPEPKTLIWKL